MQTRSIASLTMMAALGAALPALAQEAAPAAPAAPASEPRFTLSLSGAFGLGTISYQTSGRFTEFAEEGRLDADYENKSGSGIEGGLAFRLNHRLKVAAAFSGLGRDGSADYRAELPHPLYLARNRRVESTADGLSYDEQAGHLDLVVYGRAGRFDLSAFAGPSWFQVKSSFLATPPQYSHTYPFDTVNVTNVPRVAGDASAFGFNVGAGVDYRFTRNLALGTQARFARAKVDLERPNADAVAIDAGGLQVTAGVRLLF
jgi:opacity protein-like surface antigen